MDSNLVVEAIVSLEFGQVQAVQLPECQVDQEVPVVLVDRVLVVLVDTVLAVLADRVLAEAVLAVLTDTVLAVLTDTVLAVLTDTVLAVQEGQAVLRSCDDVMQIPRRNAASIQHHSIYHHHVLMVDVWVGVEVVVGSVRVDAFEDGWVEVVLKDFLPDL